jgi:hypothetical protein
LRVVETIGVIPVLILFACMVSIMVFLGFCPGDVLSWFCASIGKRCIAVLITMMSAPMKRRCNVKNGWKQWLEYYRNDVATLMDK